MNLLRGSRQLGGSWTAWHNSCEHACHAFTLLTARQLAGCQLQRLCRGATVWQVHEVPEQLTASVVASTQ